MRTLAAVFLSFALWTLTPIGSAAQTIQLPTPTTLKTPPAGTLKTKAQRARFHVDSLRLEYPVFSDGSACWKFTEPDSVVGHDARECHHESTVFRPYPATGDVDRGNLSTYYRGRWDNWSVGDRVGVIILDDGTRSRPVAANVAQ